MYTFEKINDPAENFCHKKQTAGMGEGNIWRSGWDIMPFTGAPLGQSGKPALPEGWTAESLYAGGWDVMIIRNDRFKHTKLIGCWNVFRAMCLIYLSSDNATHIPV